MLQTLLLRLLVLAIDTSFPLVSVIDTSQWLIDLAKGALILATGTSKEWHKAAIVAGHLAISFESFHGSGNISGFKCVALNKGVKAPSKEIHNRPVAADPTRRK